MVDPVVFCACMFILLIKEGKEGLCSSLFDHKFLVKWQCYPSMWNKALEYWNGTEQEIKSFHERGYCIDMCQ